MPGSDRPDLASAIHFAQQSNGPTIARGTVDRVQRIDADDGIDADGLTQADAALWLDDAATFNSAVSTKWRKVFSSDEIKAVKACVATVAGMEPARSADRDSEVFYQRTNALDTLVTAIDTWDAGAGAGNSRRPVLAVLRTEAVAQREFTTMMRDASGAVGSGKAERIRAAVDDLNASAAGRLAVLDRYAGTFGRLRDRANAGLAAAVQTLQVESNVMEARFPRLVIDDNATIGARAELVFDAFCKGLGAQYHPSRAGVDVFTAPEADCGSVSKGLVRAFAHFGVPAKSVDCGTSGFITADVPLGGAAMDGDGGSIEDRSGRFAGRRYVFPMHQVVEAAGSKWCGVVGAKWDATAHVDMRQSEADPSGYVIASDVPGDATLRAVFADDNFGIAVDGKYKKYTVRLTTQGA